jgi:tetratricopeptide (TPR) repeat protein
MHSHNALLLLMLAVAACVALPGDAHACGPHFPNTIISSDAAIKTMPAGGFESMIRQIPIDPPVEFKAVSPENYWRRNDERELTVKVDLADLKAALAESSLPEQAAAAAYKAYAAKRTAIEAHLSGPQPQRPPLPDAELTTAIPEEFREYLAGAIAWYGGNADEAGKHWQAILDMPAEQRRWRSTWAAFMLAKLAETDAEKIAGFRKVRELAAGGFKDSLGLAATSLGEEAAVELYRRRDPTAAMKLYLRQVHTGDRFAVASLRLAARDMIRKHTVKDLQKLIQDPTVLDVLTAFVASSFGDGGWSSRTYSLERSSFPKLLEAVAETNVRDVRYAGRLAWIAYRAGKYDEAATWVKRADDDAFGRWVEAKLLLRDGKTEKAAEVLAGVVASLPGDEVWPLSANKDCLPDAGGMVPKARAAGDLATLKLSQQEYVDALDLLLRNGWWMDAAYVAERVLATKELRDYVDASWGRPLKADLPADGVRPANDRQKHALLARRFRYLLARRLMREGKWDKALDYFPDASLPHVVAYARAKHKAKAPDITETERAGHLLDAAKLLRSYGMALMGTEAAPDWSVYRGSWGMNGIEAQRFRQYDWQEPWGELVPPSEDEAERVETYRAYPFRRWHYRYKAADLAWEAAKLLPDGDERTAEALWVGGLALLRTDNQRAETFFRELIDRCPDSPKAKPAAEKIEMILDGYVK